MTNLKFKKLNNLSKSKKEFRRDPKFHKLKTLATTLAN